MQPYTVRGQRVSSAREWHQVASRPVFLIVAIIAILVAPCAEASNLAVDPQNPATLYHASERGVFKSTDGGATWSPRNAGFPRQERSLYVNVLAMDPTKPRILYAGTQDRPGVGALHHAVLRRGGEDDARYPRHEFGRFANAPSGMPISRSIEPARPTSSS